LSGVDFYGPPGDDLITSPTRVHGLHTRGTKHDMVVDWGLVHRMHGSARLTCQSGRVSPAGREHGLSGPCWPIRGRPRRTCRPRTRWRVLRPASIRWPWPCGSHPLSRGAPAALIRGRQTSHPACTKSDTILKISSLRRGRDKFEADTITQTLQPPCQSMHKLVTALVVEVVCTQLLIRFVAGEPMERTHDNGAGDDHDGSFLAPKQDEEPTGIPLCAQHHPDALVFGRFGQGLVNSCPHHDSLQGQASCHSRYTSTAQNQEPVGWG
jgi:hypothetical protein